METCIGCKHLLLSEATSPADNFDRCALRSLRLSKPSPVDGIHRFAVCYAETERSTVGECGPEAKYYEPKEQQDDDPPCTQ